MQKWLAMIFGGLIVFSAIIFMSKYDQMHYAEDKDYAIKCTQSSDPFTIAGEFSCIADNHHNHDEGKPDPPWWDEFFAWPEGITALLIMLTLGAIIWQAWETRKAADAARDSIRIQEAEYFQWVDVGNWSIKPDTPIDFQLSGEVVLKKPHAVAVRITYSVLNNTPRPLFIREVRTKLQFIPSDLCRVWIVSEKREVAPKGDYKVIIDTKLEGFQVDLYITNRCAIPAIVEVQFANALGEPASADFLLFVQGGIDAISSSSKGYVSKQDGDEKGIIDSPAQTPANPN